MVSVGSSLFEISGLWFQLFAILPLAILSKISLLVASLFMCVVSGVDGMDSIRRMVLDAIERIVRAYLELREGPDGAGESSC